MQVPDREVILVAEIEGLIDQLSLVGGIAFSPVLASSVWKRIEILVVSFPDLIRCLQAVDEPDRIQPGVSFRIEPAHADSMLQATSINTSPVQRLIEVCRTKELKKTTVGVVVRYQEDLADVMLQ